MKALIKIAIIVIVVLVWNYSTDDGQTWGLQYVAAPLTNLFDLGNPGDPQYGKRARIRADRRQIENTGNKRLDEIRENQPLNADSTPDDLESRYNAATQMSYQVKVAERKLNANLDGTRILSGPVQTIDATNTGWVETGLQIFAGETLCGGGDVYNRLYTSRGQMIRVGSDGVNDKTINEFTAFDGDLPMLSLIAEIDSNVNQRFVIHSRERGCATSPFSGKLKVMVNTPYWDDHGWASPSEGAHYNRGTFSFVRVEKNKEGL